MASRILYAVAFACALSIGGCSPYPVDNAFGGAVGGCAMGALATFWTGPGAAAGCAVGAAMGGTLGAASTPPPPSPYYYPGWP